MVQATALLYFVNDTAVFIKCDSNLDTALLALDLEYGVLLWENCDGFTIVV